MSVHYKFKSALESDTVSFDGLHISVRDLKNSIMQQKRIGKNNDFDLQVTNAQTKEVYDNEEALIPKNTSLLIARVPSLQAKPKIWEGYGDNSSSPISKVDDLGAIGKAMDLSCLDASEEDKIKAMMSQSTQDYDPSNYIKIRGANQVGSVPSNYRCYKCHQGGHWIKDCSFNQGTETVEIKKSTGIPRSFMVAVEGPQVQGAMITPNGSFAVPALDHQAYTEKPQPAPPPEENKTEIPEDLVCSLCSDLLADAVMIPCCGDSYCDECIRSCLLESEEHECPACHEKDISPGTLIPNRYLRNSVTNFKSTTGYVKRHIYKPLMISSVQTSAPTTAIINIEVTSTKETKDEETPITKPVAKLETDENTDAKKSDADEVQTTVAQSTTVESDSDRKVHSEPSKITTECPPSERNASAVQTITNVANLPKRSHKMSSNDRSPRRRYHKPSPTYQEHLHRNDRGGTPTVDEPGMPPSSNMDSVTGYPTSAPLYATAPNMGMMGLPAPSVQGPGTFGAVPSYPPPNQAPILNYRLPPPGAAPYVPGGYTQHPRPMFDMGRVPTFPQVYPSGPRPKSRDYHRDYAPRRGRTPPSVLIDDPLEAFNRMLREKDERERRAKQRKARSYSHSSSRSPSPRKIRASRSPRRRSRSRSFSISRSRSRSFSPAPRISPNARHFSPKRPHRKMHNRYISPGRSPQRFRFKDDERDHRLDRERDREVFNRDGDRERDFRDREPRDRDFKYYDGYDRNRVKGRQQWNVPRKDFSGSQEQYYQTPEMAVQPPFIPPNRYPSHDVYPPHIPPQHHKPPLQLQHAPPVRKYEDDVMPPGTEQPPVPGLENAPSIEERYQYTGPKKEQETIKQDDPNTSTEFDIEPERSHKHERMGGTPERKRYSPPAHKHFREDRDYQVSPEKHHKRRRHDDLVDKRRDASDDERSSRKSKDKKKKKEKRERKEEERKKRKERKEKREQEKLNKKALEEKEKSDRKQKRDMLKHDAERQATNDEEEENSDAAKYDDRSSKYHTTDKLEHKREDLEDHKHYDEDTIAHIDGPEIINDGGEDSQETEDVSSHKDSLRDDDIHSPEKHNTESDLYGDLLTEGIDNTVIENYGKLKTSENDSQRTDQVIVEHQKHEEEEDRDEGEITDDDDEDSEKDVLELHTNESELKMEVKNEVLAPLPERSKWEVDEDVSIISSLAIGQHASKGGDRTDKFGKVTTEVLKRAENAIFAKAINAIRPIEIKKISLDRAKLYSGERDKDKSGDELREDAKNIHITITGSNNYDNDVVTVEPDNSPPKARLSVKERLGCKVDDLDRIVKIEKPYDRNRSHSLSPLSRRSDLMSRNLGQGERRFEGDNRNRSNNSRGNVRDRNRDFHHKYRNDRHDIKTNNRNRRDVRQDRDRKKDDHRRDHKRILKIDEDDKKVREKRKTSRSKSGSDKDRHKRKDRRDKKKDKVKRHVKDVDNEVNKQPISKTKNDAEKGVKMLPATDKRKPTLDEASFEPDYDLESESDKEDVSKKGKGERIKQSDAKSAEPDVSRKRPKVDSKKLDTSSTESSETSSEDERKRRKHRKHKKRKNNKDSSSSSSSESESDSSDDERDKRKKRHKKKLKKKKKSKH